MRKIWIVARSEFLRRVRTRSFLWTTLLAPIVLVTVTILPGVLTAVAYEQGSARTIAVLDQTGVLAGQLRPPEQLILEPVEVDEASARAAVRAGAYAGYLLLPADLLETRTGVRYYSAEGGGLSVQAEVRGMVRQAVRRHQLAERATPPDVLAILEADVAVEAFKLTDGGEAADHTLAVSIVGYVMGFLIYFCVFIYGATVMHSVIEEKTSRVVEIMVSSVRPFHLLMGKLLGVGAMGLAQLLIWGVLVGVGTTLLGAAVPLVVDPAAMGLPAGTAPAAMSPDLPMFAPAVFVWFVLFFLGGYLLYASIFAAIGSAVEHQQDAQGLLMPVSFLILVPILLITLVLESPHAPLSVGLSFVPFFSPILMVVRLAVTDVPLWEVSLSFALLAGFFVTAVWLGARIYRVGILMYGKKPTVRELARWVRQP